MTTDPLPSRRDFLGRPFQRDAETFTRASLVAGDTLRLSKVAMACDFEVVLNPGGARHLHAASEALDLVDRLEDQMTVYRPHSELSRLNARAADESVEVEPLLFGLLHRAISEAARFEGAFDPTSGPLIALWRRCRQESRLPTPAEVEQSLAVVGYSHVSFDADAKSVRFDRPGVELNLGAIGKGYALDRAAEILEAADAADWLLHGGASSILARGGHNDLPGWPVGIRHPLFPDKTLGTVLLCNQGMSTSGSGGQFFRIDGKRYGHLLDPRSGWPAEALLSVTVLAPSAAQAEVLSTAFFVLGREAAMAYCREHPDIGVVLVEPGHTRMEPIVAGISPDHLRWAGD